MRHRFLGAICLLALAMLGPFSGTATTSFSEIQLSDIIGASLSADPINGSDNATNRIPAGTILMYRTDEGRYGVLEIVSYGQDLTLNWRTYNADGSVYGSGNGLVVRASFTCDLDRGVEGSSSADFQWHLATSVERYIQPLAGATFGVVQPSATIFTPAVPVGPGRPPAPVPRTGQTSCFGSTYSGLSGGACCLCATGAYTCDNVACPEGQDGQLRMGAAWPVPRFTDNDNGTITDNLTGLTWLRDANCFQSVDWEDALHQVGRLEDGLCGLADGSAPGDWRLPNVRELQSLIRYGLDERTFHTGGAQYAIPNTLGTGKYQDWDPFINVYWGLYWTSTTYADWGLTIDLEYLTYGAIKGIRQPDECTAWYVDVRDGRVFGADVDSDKSWYPKAAWPVRDSGASRVPRTGQSWCYEAPSGRVPSSCSGLPEECGHGNLPAGQDGDLQAGVPWPVPRFTDNGDGTVTDNLTGLIWLKDANCFGEQTWFAALDLANSLRSGECGLNDGSVEGDWRLPNVLELESLIHYGFVDPAVPDTVGDGKCQNGDPFLNLRSWFYWTSTTYEICARRDPISAWCVNMFDGHLTPGTEGYAASCFQGSLIFHKEHRFLVWPVRGG